MKKKSDLLKIGALSLLLSAGSITSVWGNDFLQDVKLSIQQTNVSIGKVLDDIEQKTGYSILVRDSDIDTSKKITVNQRNADLSCILDTIFAGMGVKCDVTDKTISIYRPAKEAQNRVADQKRRVSGVVVDSQGEPVIGANILEKGTGSNGTITDVEGGSPLMSHLMRH